MSLLKIACRLSLFIQETNIYCAILPQAIRTEFSSFLIFINYLNDISSFNLVGFVTSKTFAEIRVIF